VIPPKPKAVNIHGSCVQLAAAGRRFSAPYRTGVLLLGASGAGKSQLTLRLLAAGARLIADDRIELYARRGRLRARPPRGLAGLLEIRGLGIVKLPYAASVDISLVVRLVSQESVAQLPARRFYKPEEAAYLRVRRWPPLVELANDVSTPAKIAVAAAAFSRYLFRETRNP
jgi:HPr kinase/phosphorylase